MIAAVILSAGESRRMGSPKALLPYPLGEGRSTTFVEHLIEVFGGSRAEPLLLVLGHEPATIRDAVDTKGAQVIINRDYPKGMLSSIQTAVRALEASEAEGMILCPVDHPEVTSEVVDELIDRFEATRAPIVLPVVSGRRGHPVLFSRSVFGELLSAPETVGARRVVWDHESNLLEVEVTVPGIRVDIDTPEEYRTFRQRAEDD